MSYVLEALKKAEAERNPNARVSLVQEQAERRRSRWLQWGIIVALLANLLVLTWLFFPVPEEDATPATPVASTDVAPTLQGPADEGLPVAAAQSADEAVAAPVPAPTGSPQAPAPTRPVVEPPETPSAPPPRIRVDLDRLPAEVRRRFPGLAFSTHVYAEDASLRALVVNGTRLVEGDRLGALTLEEITEEGAVFGFERYLVAVSVLETWE